MGWPPTDGWCLEACAGVCCLLGLMLPLGWDCLPRTGCGSASNVQLSWVPLVALCSSLLGLRILKKPRKRLFCGADGVLPCEVIFVGNPLDETIPTQL